MNKSILLVGCGNMGFAMLRGWPSSIDNSNVTVVEPNDELRARAGKEEVNVFASADEIPATLQPDLIVLAVKPQVMDSVVPAYKAWANGHTAFLSVAAGIKVETLLGLLGAQTPVIRCMPNTPSAINKGMLVCWGNRNVTQAVIDLSTTLLSASGEVLWVEDEELMDAVTAVSGSGPAYLFHFIECMAAAGKSTGLPDDVAEKLALQTIYGAASLARYADVSPSILRQQVTSPGGTTAAALEVLMEEDRLKMLVFDAVSSARERSIELGINSD